MKVVAFNGSPRQEGNTAQLLDTVLGELRAAGVQAERVDIAKARPFGCRACMLCAQRKDRRCAISTDAMNEWIAQMAEADGIIIGSPTYFANVSSETKALIDRAGMVARVNDGLFRRKAGAAVIAVRRGGAVPAFDAVNHMFQINEMVVVGSLYWNFAVGRAPGEVQADAEGMANMRNLGQNMAWLLQRITGG